MSDLEDNSEGDMAQQCDLRVTTVPDEIAGSVGEAAYRRLRGDLIFGRIAPGRGCGSKRCGRSTASGSARCARS